MQEKEREAKERGIRNAACSLSGDVSELVDRIGCRIGPSLLR